MRFISTRTHAYLDYIIAVLLIAAPWLLDFAAGGAETIIPVALGVGIILMNLFTDHEVSVTRSFSMPGHLSVDIFAGIFLAVSPWLFGFADFVWVPHLVVGIIILAEGLFTSKVPESCPKGTPCYETRRAHRTAH